MDAAGWRRRRTRATIAGLAMLAVLAGACVALWCLDQARWVLTL